MRGDILSCMLLYASPRNHRPYWFTVFLGPAILGYYERRVPTVCSTEHEFICLRARSSWILRAENGIDARYSRWHHRRLCEAMVSKCSQTRHHYTIYDTRRHPIIIRITGCLIPLRHYVYYITQGGLRDPLHTRRKLCPHLKSPLSDWRLMWVCKHSRRVRCFAIERKYMDFQKNAWMCKT